MPADTFAPDFGQNVNPDGSVTVELTGGLQLNAAEAGLPADRAVRWVRESDGVLVAQLAASVQGVIPHVLLRTEGTDGDGTYLDVVAQELTSPNSASLRLQQDPGGAEVSVKAGAIVGPPSLTKILARDDGASSFLQLAAVESLQLDYGAVVFNGFAGGTASDELVVPHALGRTPALVIVSNQYIPGVVSVTGYSALFTATDFLAYGRADVPYNSSIIHTWVAIG